MNKLLGICLLYALLTGGGQVRASTPPGCGGETKTGTAKLVLASDFETGSIQHWIDPHDGWDIQDGGIAINNEIVTNRTRNANSKYSMRLHLKRSQWYEPAPSKVRLPTAPAMNTRSQVYKPISVLPFNHGTEYWIGFSLFAENISAAPNGVNQGVGFFELKGTGGSANGTSFIITNDGDRVKCMVTWGTGVPYSRAVLWDVPVSAINNRWTDFVVRIVPSFGNTGQTQIWVNGVLGGANSIGNGGKLLNHPNAYSGYNGIGPVGNQPWYPVAMLYNPNFVHQLTGPQQYTAYFDSLRIAQGSGGFSLVNPANY